MGCVDRGGPAPVPGTDTDPLPPVRPAKGMSFVSAYFDTFANRRFGFLGLSPSEPMCGPLSESQGLFLTTYGNRFGGVSSLPMPEARMTELGTFKSPSSVWSVT